jgi:hypothetical protein
MVRAQSQVAFAFALTDPTGELNRDIDTFSGPSLTYLREVGSSEHWSLGLSGIGGTYGGADRPVALPGYHARTENSVVFFMGVLQLKAGTGALQPYIQGTAGYGSFATTTTIGCDECGLGDEFTGQITDHSDGTFVAGGSAGLLMRVYQRKPRPAVGAVASGPEREGLRIYLDLSARHLRGGNAEYLPGDPVITDEGLIEMEDLAESSFQAFQYLIGASFAF